MATVTRSSRRLKDEESNSSKKRNGGKLKDPNGTSNTGSATNGTYDLRRSVRETPAKKQQSSSLLSTVKPGRLENRTPPTLVKRKSERVEKKRMPSLPSRSERGEKRHSLSSSASASKKSGKSSTSMDTKKKRVNKVKSGKQAALGSGEQRKTEKQDEKLADILKNKKRSLDACSYRALFKPHSKKVKQPDRGGKRRRKDNSSQGDSANEGAGGSTEVQVGVDECSDKNGEEPRGKDLLKGSEEAVESSDSRELADGISINDNEGTGGSKEVEGGVDECSGKTGVKLRGKDIRKLGLEAVEIYSSGSSEIADGVSINDKGNIKSARVNRKREFCMVEAQESKCKDKTSLSRYIDSLLQSSPADLVANGTVGDAARLEVDCLDREDLQEPVKDGDMVSIREDLQESVKDDDKVSIREDLLPTPDCILSTSEVSPPPSAVVLERDGTVGALKRKRNVPDQDPDLSAAAMTKSCDLETSSVDAISSHVVRQSSKLNNSCFACFKRKRVDRDSQYQEVCSCNRTYNDLCDIASSEELPEEIAPLRTSQKDKIVGHSLLDQDATEQSTVVQTLSVHDLTYSPISADISVPPKEDRRRHEVSDSIYILEGCHDNTQLKESPLDTPTDGDCNACVICKLGGKILCCDGKGCKRNYHLSCLDPPLKDVPYGVWHCLPCVKKKIVSGVHSVSEGVESVWDIREIEVLAHEGMLKEKQYLVKYRGLAHVHNRWIPESQLLHEASVLVAKFNRRNQKEKIARWKLEWTVPQRIVQKRLLMTLKQANEYISEHGTDISSCRYEWLVKWKGLGYEHATWELESASFLSSCEAATLVKDYESRHEKGKKAFDPSRGDKAEGLMRLHQFSLACREFQKVLIWNMPEDPHHWLDLRVLQDRKASIYELPNFPSGFPSGLEDHLSFLDKLCEYWHKCQNAIVIDDQERIMKVILFIISLQSDVCRPFLIITTSTTIPVWEAELVRLAPSVNSVVYTGNKDVRKSIRELEFYEKSGCVMFQVLVSSPDAIVEDFEALKCVEWEAIIVDDCQHSRVSKHYEKISMLISNFRLLLASGHIKDNIHEYLNLLSILEFGDEVHADSLKTDSNDNTTALPALKERLARYIAYERKSDSSKIIEYWVPVCLSTVQLEKYCATLLSNSITLYSCSKNDPVGALREMLISARKCCDHPYLVDVSLQSALTKGHPEVEYLDIGVNASGKLKLLDKILQEIKNRGLRVLILFQSIGGSGRNSIGDILDDFLRQRFGPDSYERVDSGLAMSKKQAALNMFNNMERGRFVFLIENRACQPSIKLTAVDAVIIFDSDWNPLNDLRALQKINIDSQVEQLKVFRLYSTCTVEEKILIFSKQDMTLESNIQNISRSTSHMLLIWGASYLFDRLDEFHGFSSPSSGSVTSCEQSLLDDAMLEMLSQLPPHGIESNNMSNFSVIKEAQHRGAIYSKNISLLGELKMQSAEEELPHVFWKKLLEGRYPQWRYLSAPSPRARKKVQYLDELPKMPEAENEEARKKHKKGGNNPIDPISPKTSLEDKRKPISSDKEDKMAVATTFACNSIGSSLIYPKKAPNPCSVMKDSGASRSQADNLHSLPRSLTNNDHNHGSHMPSLAPSISEVSDVNMVESEGRKKLRDAQATLHLLLKPNIAKLCDILQLPNDVKQMAGKFLEYVMNNHHVSREPVFILQAFQIALCWTAASFLKRKVDRRESLTLAKQHLNFNCKEEEAETVYSKLRMLKKRFPRQTCASGNATKLTYEEMHSSSPRNEDVEQHARTAEATASDQKNLEEGEMRESSPSYSLSRKFPVESEQASGCEEANTCINTPDSVNPPECITAKGSHDPCFVEKYIKHIEEIFNQRTNAISLKQQEETGKFIQFREKEKKKLNEEHRLESDSIFRTHDNPLVRSDVLKKLDAVFLRKRAEFDKRMVNYQKKMIDMQQLAKDKEKRIKARWLEEAGFGQLPKSFSFSKLPLPDTGLIMEYMDREQNIGDDMGETVRKSGPSSQLKNVTSAVLKPGERTVVSGKSTDTPARVLREGIEEGMPIGNVTLTTQSSSRIVVSSESDGLENAALERHIEAESSGRVRSVSPPQQFQNDLPSLALSHTHTSLGQSVDTPARDLTEETESGNVTLSTQSRNKDVVSSESDGMENTASEGHCEADNSGHVHPVSSPQQFRIELPSTQAHTSHGHDNAQSSHQVPSTDHNQTLVSAGVGDENMPSCGRQSSHHQIEVLTLHPVDAISSQVEQANDNGSDTHSDVRLHLAPVDAPVEHNQPATSVMGIQDESSSERCRSQQAEVAMQQPPEDLSSQVEQHNRLTSYSFTQLPSHVYMDMPLRGMPMASLGSSTGMIQEPSSRPPQNMTALQSQVLYAGPLQNELNKIRREEEKATKMHEDEKIRLKSECEREIEEVRRKYNGFILDAEMMFQQQLKAIQTNFSKVCKNLMLAEAFRLMLTDATKSRATASVQGLPLTSSRQSSMQSLPQNARRPASAQTPPPARVVQRPPALSLGNQAGPHISPIIPPPVNHQVRSEPRAPAPHLQPFRPTSMPAASDHFPPLSRTPSQQLHNSLVATSSHPQLPVCPPSLSGTCSGTNLPNDTSALPAFHNRSTSALELLRDMDNQSGTNLLNLLTEPGSTFDSLNPINLTMGAGGQGTASSEAACPSTAKDVISLSDDD